MKIVLSLLVTLTFAAGIASALQKFGHPCGEGEKEAEKTCDSTLGLFCSESLKICECQSLNSSTGSEIINPIWNKGECAIKIQDTCLITNSSASPSTENGAPIETSSTSTPAPAPAPAAFSLSCIKHAECINATCQCMHDHHPSKDLTTCTKSGAFSITGIPLFVGIISMAMSISISY